MEEHLFVDLPEVRLAYRRYGAGDGLIVLLHGWPETSACWERVAPQLADEYTVVCPDLRGYGASGLAATGYDKRHTAADLHHLVRALGWESARVAGHDRGARVAHRWALDHPADIDRLALLDILPIREVAAHLDVRSASWLWHWFFHLQEGLPELLLRDRTDDYLRHFLRDPIDAGAIGEHVLAEYFAAYRDPAHLAAGLDDYRAALGVDLQRDEADHAAGRRLATPLLVLWGDRGGLRKDPVVDIWREYATDVQGAAVAQCGHYLPEEQPALVVAALRNFFRE